MALIWDHYRLKGKQLPYIIPVIFLSQCRGMAPKRLDELLPQGSALLEYVPKFSMPFYDLARQQKSNYAKLKRECHIVVFLCVTSPTEQLERKFAEAIVLLNKVFDDDFRSNRNDGSRAFLCTLCKKMISILKKISEESVIYRRGYHYE